MKVELISSYIIQASNRAITSEIFRETYRIGTAFSRSGKLSFSNLIYFILQSTHRSISMNYARLLDSLSSEDLPFVSKQAISKARQGISHEAFVALFRLSVNEFYTRSKRLKTWNGFSVYAIDGSTLQIPESKENLQVFGYNPNQSGKASPLASVSALYDVLNDILVDVSFLPYRYNEREAAKKHIPFLPNLSNRILLFDRGYPSEDFFRFLHSKNLLFLMRLPKTFKKAILKPADALFCYPATKDREGFTLRSIHFPLEDGTIEYLVTNIMPEQLPLESFKELYQIRWGIESKYRELKNRLEIEAFNCIKPISIYQEFFAAIFLSNLVAIIKHEADSSVIVSEMNKHQYQVNRSYLFNRIKAKLIYLLKVPLYRCQTLISRIIQESSKILSIVRPNRKFGRYRKNTRRRCYNHIKSCL